MNTNTCPLGGDCFGTGWLWRGGSDYPYPEPPEWYPCKCNPRADGDPNQLLDYGWRSGAKRCEAVTPPEPF